MSSGIEVEENARTAGTDEQMLELLGSRGRRRTSERYKARLRWLFVGDRPQPVGGFAELYEPPERTRNDVGICCSGGGIRSAAFNLGALQTLQKEQVLQTSKYLSAVSGGSYIAAALCMVAKTWDPRKYGRCSLPGAGDEGCDDSDPELVTDDSPPFEPGSPEERYLRNHLAYLAPDGLARVHLGLRMLAGMLLNVLLVGLPTFAVGLVVGWAAHVHYGLSGDGTFAIPPEVWIPVVALAVLALGFAMLGLLVRARRDWQRIFIETWQVRFFLFAVAGAVVLVAVPWLANQLFDDEGVTNSDAEIPGAATLSSIAALAAAAIAQVRGHVRDQKRLVSTARKRLGRFAKPVREALLALVVALVGPLLLVAIYGLGVLVGVITQAGGDSIDFGWLGNHTPEFLLWLGGSLVGFGVLWTFVDLTSLSLHPFYRRRLATAFALKRIWENAGGKQARPPLEGRQDSRSGGPVARERQFDEIVELSRSGVEPGWGPIKSWPMLIVCAAANISDPGATPPGRAVASFTFSPTAIGGPVTGAAATREYEQLSRNRRRDVTLPAAVAMSGAALAPSMGKLTRRPLTFLLGLANIRLGVWVPNPRHINDSCTGERGEGPRRSSLTPRDRRLGSRSGTERISVTHRPRPHYLLKEMLGRNRLEDKFLYVTDGGHYENLGLVELLRRGCRTIYCFDAGGGSSSAALVDAIALARSELNVTIDMKTAADDLDAKEVREDGPRRSRHACAVGLITYPDGVKGTLIYARSTVWEGAPWELMNFQEADNLFPHHSTVDQFLDDQKFEAYRLLGMKVAEGALSQRLLHVVTPANVAATNGGMRRRMWRLRRPPVTL